MTRKHVRIRARSETLGSNAPAAGQTPTRVTPAESSAGAFQPLDQQLGYDFAFGHQSVRAAELVVNEHAAGSMPSTW